MEQPTIYSCNECVHYGPLSGRCGKDHSERYKFQAHTCCDDFDKDLGFHFIEEPFNSAKTEQQEVVMVNGHTMSYIHLANPFDVRFPVRVWINGFSNTDWTFKSNDEIEFHPYLLKGDEVVIKYTRK